MADSDKNDIFARLIRLAMRFTYLYTENVVHTPVLNQVVFVAREDAPCLNRFFDSHYEEVVELFKQHHCEFIYLPRIYTPSFVSELVSYNYPSSYRDNLVNLLPQKAIQSVYNAFFIDDKSDGLPLRFYPFDFDDAGHISHFWRDGEGRDVGLARQRVLADDHPLLPDLSPWWNDEQCSRYDFAELLDGSDQEIWDQLNEYFRHYEGPHVIRSLTKYSHISKDESMVMHNAAEKVDGGVVLHSHLGDFDIDSQFEDVAFQITKEIRERVEKLRLMGVNELAIKSLFEEKLRLSHLQVTKDFKILMNDYDNREIKMGPLPKSVFLLFLLHPEGIIFKQIENYRAEVMFIYCSIIGRDPDVDVCQSIRQLTSPYYNSLNENCSRIRQAFLKEFEDRIAEYYYVTGSRATPKRIRLDRQLVHFQDQDFVRRVRKCAY